MGGIERLKAGFQKINEYRYRIYYGPGIEDVFLNDQNQELKFDQALYETLHELGFERIIFFSPHRSLFVYDERSLILSKGLDESEKGNLDTGPLNEYRAFPSEVDSSKMGVQEGMGDVHALRILDTLMKQETGPLTAIVFLQAEIGLKHFEDRRTLAGVVGEWAYLGSKNRNTCILVFSVNSFEALEGILQETPVPEIRKVVNKEKGGLFYINEASLEEIERGLKLKTNNGVDTKELSKLVNLLAREGKTLRHWLNQLNAVEGSKEILSPEFAEKEGWIKAIVRPGESAFDQMDQLVGLENVKKRVEEYIAWAQVRQKQNVNALETPNLHMIFSGNPGTGKTTVARLMGEIFHGLGWLKRGHLIEVQGGDLLAEFVGGTPAKVNSIIDQALDGVLFIDEAYSLAEQERGGYGQEALEILLSRMENERNRLVVICAGYAEKMDQFRRSNPGLTRRFPQQNILYFEDYGPEALYEILLGMLKKRNLEISQDFQPILKDLIIEISQRRIEGFGNAGEVRNLVDGFERSRALRVIQNGLPINSPITTEDIPESYRMYLPVISAHVNGWDSKLRRLVGLEEIKGEFFRLRNRLEFERLRYQAGVHGAGKTLSRHFIFVGNPGTGKTTVGRLIGELFHEMGLLGRGHFVEVTRAELVAGYVGQTALKTREKIKSALDGVLLIDEAYALGIGDDFGQEAITEIVKGMEVYRDRLVVIAAGYPEQMRQFLDTNPGLASRFGEIIEFLDFNDEELWEIMAQLLTGENYQWDETITEKIVRYLEWQRYRDGIRFGNARSVQRLFEEIKARAAVRIIEKIESSNISPTPQLLSTLTTEDVPEPGFYLQLEAVPTTKAIAIARV
jgi:SpoVK/Ycf46/Vps4 family AAA+-type ATPase